MPNQQMTTEQSLKESKALVMLREGVTAFRDTDSGTPGHYYFVDLRSVVVWCGRRGIEFEQPLTDRMKGGYPSLVDALAAAHDVLHPGEVPDAAVLLRGLATALLASTILHADALRRLVTLNGDAGNKAKSESLERDAERSERLADETRRFLHGDPAYVS